MALGATAPYLAAVSCSGSGINHFLIQSFRKSGFGQFITIRLNVSLVPSQNQPAFVKSATSVVWQATKQISHERNSLFHVRVG
uniref:Uncharacterized protein n=1 Tax=Physcomitrium patens TaxID=3218 RepID=A0A2K1L9H9_PHYPA|nr:hypothetical protein PHYPA_001114 [Physcomitrium patens]